MNWGFGPFFLFVKLYLRAACDLWKRKGFGRSVYVVVFFFITIEF